MAASRPGADPPLRLLERGAGGCRPADSQELPDHRDRSVRQSGPALAHARPAAPQHGVDQEGRTVALFDDRVSRALRHLEQGSAGLRRLRQSRQSTQGAHPKKPRRAGTKPRSRRINWRLRATVLLRDKCACRMCGASPAKNPAVTLQIDHIKPGQGAAGRPWTISRHCAPLAISARATGHAHRRHRKDRSPAAAGVGARGRGGSLDRYLSAHDLGQVRGGVLSGAVRVVLLRLELEPWHYYLRVPPISVSPQCSTSSTPTRRTSAMPRPRRPAAPDRRTNWRTIRRRAPPDLEPACEVKAS